MGGPWEDFAPNQDDGPWNDYATRDAPADSSPQHPYLDAAVKAFNPLQSLAQNPLGDLKSGERALLTNEPTQNIGEAVLRGAPAALGGAIGGAAGLVAGAPLTVGAVATSAGGAALGGGAGEAVRQAMAQTYSALTGRGRVQGPQEVMRDVATQAALQVPGQVMNLGTGLLGKYYANRLPTSLQSFFQVPEQMTKYVQKRGPDAVFAPQNLVEDAPLNNVGQATSDLAARRAAVGEGIGNSEDFALGIGAAQKPVPTQEVAGQLRDTMTRRGYLDPKTSDLARGKDASILRKVLDALEEKPNTQRLVKETSESPILDQFGKPVKNVTTSVVGEAGGGLDLRQVINAKRLIDSHLDFSGTINKEISAPTEAILKNTNNALREKVRAEMGSAISGLYDDFGKIADAQEKLAEFTGTRALSNVEQRAVQALRGIMNKNPGEVENIVKILGEGLPGGEAQARQIFDSIAGNAFTKDSVGAPSSVLLKGATAGGLLSAPVARGAVRFGQFLGNPATIGEAMSRNTIPAGVYGPGLTPLAEHYLRQRPAQ